jgi:DNA-binding ferritin-like protein (Dps family)
MRWPSPGRARRVALIRVLGAVAYGEWKAYEGLRRRADETADPEERRLLRTFAAQERRHYEGFVRRLEALGADPDRAMRPYRAALDAYHGREVTDPVEDAVFGYLGEGIADDLLQWLRQVVDPDTAAFVDSVIADEEQHEGHATAELRALLADVPGGRARAARAAGRMIRHMLGSGTHGAAPMAAFLQVGRPAALLRAIVGGFDRRMRAIGVGPGPVLRSVVTG